MLLARGASTALDRAAPAQAASSRPAGPPGAFSVGGPGAGVEPARWQPDSGPSASAAAPAGRLGSAAAAEVPGAGWGLGLALVLPGKSPNLPLSGPGVR